MRSRRLAAPLLGALVALASVTVASADGEAGLVIQDGNEVRTYCVPFTGDGIEGDDLLLAAGQTFDAYGGGSGLALCSIGSRGCQDAGSFSSCFCECQGGDCTYWAFFTREHDADWVYSARAFNLLRAGDGDVHGWKWGKGGANSAPAPQDVTFEQICGHAPRGGATPAVTLPPNPTPAAGATSAEAVTSTSEAPKTPATSISGLTASPSATSFVTLPGTAAPTPILPDLAGPSSNDGDEASSSLSLVTFGIIIAALVAAISAAVVWRKRHGA